MATREMETGVTDLRALEAERQDLERSMADIRLQIGHARARVITDGEYSDPDWYTRAQHALRVKGQRHQTILRHIADIRRQQRQEKAASFERGFIAAARRRLTPELFNDLMQEARDSEVR